MTYQAIYTHAPSGEVISSAEFTTISLKLAKILAQSHKRHTPEIDRYGRAIKTRVSVWRKDGARRIK